MIPIERGTQVVTTVLLHNGMQCNFVFTPRLRNYVCTNKAHVLLSVTHKV